MEDRADREERLREMGEGNATGAPMCPRCKGDFVMRAGTLTGRARIDWRPNQFRCLQCGNEFSLDPFAGEENTPF